MILKNCYRRPYFFLVVRLMLKTNSAKFEKIWSKFGGSRRPPKTLGGVFAIKCHNSRTSWPIKLIIHSSDAE